VAIVAACQEAAALSILDGWQDAARPSSEAPHSNGVKHGTEWRTSGPKGGDKPPKLFGSCSDPVSAGGARKPGDTSKVNRNKNAASAPAPKPAAAHRTGTAPVPGSKPGPRPGSEGGGLGAFAPRRYPLPLG
jgi:hypothetical protein